jgi:hypothetical protein
MLVRVDVQAARGCGPVALHHDPASSQVRPRAGRRHLASRPRRTTVGPTAGSGPEGRAPEERTALSTERDAPRSRLVEVDARPMELDALAARITADRAVLTVRRASVNASASPEPPSAAGRPSAPAASSDDQVEPRPRCLAHGGGAANVRRGRADASGRAGPAAGGPAGGRSGHALSASTGLDPFGHAAIRVD